MAKLIFYTRRALVTLILMIVLAGLGYDCLTAPLGLKDLVALRRHQAQLETVRNRLLADNGVLKERIQKLRSNDRYIEHLIRRELGYARPDELVYRFAKGLSTP